MKKYTKLTLTALLCISMFACEESGEEFFELINPPTSPWPSLADFEKAPIGAYYTLSGNAGSRTVWGWGRAAAEAPADMIQLASQAEGFISDPDMLDLYNRAQAGKQVTSLDTRIWYCGYFAVGHANGGIDFIEENDGNPYPFENRPDEIDRIKGELHFVRAYGYYWLAKMYLPVYPNDEKRIPWRINQAKSYDQAVSSELASANDVYAQIVSDLQEAKNLLPERYIAGVHHPSYEDGRANKFAAAALLAKVHFHMGNYADALTELNFVIDQNGGDYDLTEEPIEAWNKTGIDRGREVIWYYTLWAGDGLGGPSNWKHPSLFRLYNAASNDSEDPATNTLRFMPASDSFLQTAGWMNPDGSENPVALNDLRYTQLFVRYEAGNDPRTAYNTTKPYVWGNKYYRSGVRRSTNLPLLRLADMYLLRATIHAMNNSNVEARADLNMVRNRAGIGDFGGTDTELMDAIEVERMKEMAFEGDRLYYLQGLKKDIPNGDRGAGSVPYDGNFISEVPDFEVDLNKGYQ